MTASVDQLAQMLLTLPTGRRSSALEHIKRKDIKLFNEIIATLERWQKQTK